MPSIEAVLGVLARFLTETVPADELHTMVNDEESVLVGTRTWRILEEFRKLEEKGIEIPKEIQGDLHRAKLYFYA